MMHLSPTFHKRPHVVRRDELLFDTVNFEILNTGGRGVQSELVELVCHLDAERVAILIGISHFVVIWSMHS